MFDALPNLLHFLLKQSHRICVKWILINHVKQPWWVNTPWKSISEGFVVSSSISGVSGSGANRLWANTAAGIILWMCPTNKRRPYIVRSSLIGWAHSQNDPWAVCSAIDDVIVFLPVHFFNLIKTTSWKKWFILLLYLEGTQCNINN